MFFLPSAWWFAKNEPIQGDDWKIENGMLKEKGSAETIMESVKAKAEGYEAARVTSLVSPRIARFAVRTEAAALSLFAVF